MISPCIGICKLEENICTGCGRTSSEIQEWRGGDEETHKKILTESVARLDKYAYGHWVNKYKAKVKRLKGK
jgi:predicted Fe-S protein YdhL (DUF1289 family)